MLNLRSIQLGTSKRDLILYPIFFQELISQYLETLSSLKFFKKVLRQTGFNNSPPNPLNGFQYLLMYYSFQGCKTYKKVRFVKFLLLLSLTNMTDTHNLRHDSRNIRNREQVRMVSEYIIHDNRSKISISLSESQIH